MVMVIVIAPLQVGVTDSQLLDTSKVSLDWYAVLCYVGGLGTRLSVWNQTHESLFAVANN